MKFNSFIKYLIIFLISLSIIQPVKADLASDLLKLAGDAAAKNKADKYIPTEQAVQIYLTKNEIGMRDFNDLKLFAKEDLYSDLKKIETQVDVYRK